MCPQCNYEPPHTMEFSEIKVQRLHFQRNLQCLRYLWNIKLKSSPNSYFLGFSQSGSLVQVELGFF